MLESLVPHFAQESRPVRPLPDGARFRVHWARHCHQGRRGAGSSHDLHGSGRPPYGHYLLRYFNRRLIALARARVVTTLCPHKHRILSDQLGRDAVNNVRLNG